MSMFQNFGKTLLLSRLADELGQWIEEHQITVVQLGLLVQKDPLVIIHQVLEEKQTNSAQDIEDIKHAARPFLSSITPDDYAVVLQNLSQNGKYQTHAEMLYYTNWIAWSRLMDAVVLWLQSST